MGSGEETSYLPPEELSMASTMLENCGESASRTTPHWWNDRPTQPGLVLAKNLYPSPSHSHPVRLELLGPFYRTGSCDSLKPSDLTKATQRESGRRALCLALPHTNL